MAYIAIKNGIPVTSNDKKEWHSMVGTFTLVSENVWSIIYENTSGEIVEITYTNGLYTLTSNSETKGSFAEILHSKDGITWTHYCV